MQLCSDTEAKDYTTISKMFSYLESYAVWDQKLDYELFNNLQADSYRRFSKKALKENKVPIFECAFLQDNITELMLYYQNNEDEIVESFHELIVRSNTRT